MNLIPGVAASDELKVLEEATYQTAMYLPLHDMKIKDNTNLGVIIEKGYKEYDNLDASAQDSLNTLRDICEKHPEFTYAKIGNQSWNNKDAYDPTGFRACTFERNGQLNVCFRGTPEGSWVDNGKGMTGDIGADYLKEYKGISVSPMQLCAINYMEGIIERERGLPIVLSGHSKGGNETQLVAVIFSEYIKAAYSLDGQGFPPEVVEQLKKLPGWEDALKKIVGINADNDYVHGLGMPIILPENMIYLQTPGTDESLGGILGNHYISSLFNNGNLADRGAEGPVAKSINEFSKALMECDDLELRAQVCFLIMNALQKWYAKAAPVNGEVSGTTLNENARALLQRHFLDILAHADMLKSTSGRLYILGELSSLAAAANSENLLDYAFLLGEPEPDAAEEFLGDHDFETEQQIADYLEEHTENGKLEYLVRGALLRCRYGTHARQLNLLKCHGVYIGTHPVIHDANCIAQTVNENYNITYFGVCNAPVPPPTEKVVYKKDLPRNPDGSAAGEGSTGVVDGRKCQPEIIGRTWFDAYPKTRIVDNGELEPMDRNSDSPKGRSAVTTLSFLVCRYGGLIEPYNSGQSYESDEEELANENDRADEPDEQNTMYEAGGEGNIYGSGFVPSNSRSLNGKELSEDAGYMVDAMAPSSPDGEIMHYNWHNIDQFLKSNPENMNIDKYEALCYVFNTMTSADEIGKFINMGYTATEVPGLEKPRPRAGEVLTQNDSYAYFYGQAEQRVIAERYELCKPNEVLKGMTHWYRYEREQGSLSGTYQSQADIMAAICETETGVFVPFGEGENPIKLERDRLDYVLTIPPGAPGNENNKVRIAVGSLIRNENE